MVGIGEIVVVASLGKTLGIIAGYIDTRKNNLNPCRMVVQGNGSAGEPSLQELQGIINGLFFVMELSRISFGAIIAMELANSCALTAIPPDKYRQSRRDIRKNGLWTFHHFRQ